MNCIKRHSQYIMKSLKISITQVFFIYITCFYIKLSINGNNLSHINFTKNLEVTLNYWQQINGFFAYNEILPDDCKIKNTISKSSIICPVWFKIIINKKRLLSWQQEQKKNGFINLYLPKIGILHEKVKIAKIKKIIQQTPTNKNQQLVTSVYMRYAHVLKYKIKDIDTGEMSEIIVTPEHKLYETTNNKFIAISELGLNNMLINASNHHLKISCPNKRQNNCGETSLNSLQKVYNIEVEKAHNYFVGNIKILVHNGCNYYYKCLECKEIHAEKNYFPIECKKIGVRHEFRTVYQCEFCGVTSARKKIINDHETYHKEDPLGNYKYSCDLCSVKFIFENGLRSHKRMHAKNGNVIFCRECDTRVSLKEKANSLHEHKLNVLFQESTKFTSSRDRSRSPITDFSRIEDILYMGETPSKP